MSNKHYVCPARGDGKSRIALKQIMDAVEDGYEVVFIDPPRHGKTTCDTDVLSKLREYVYDLHAIKEPDPLMEEYFHRLYPIEPLKQVPMDTIAWLKANPSLLTVPLFANKEIAFIKLKEKGE